MNRVTLALWLLPIGIFLAMIAAAAGGHRVALLRRRSGDSPSTSGSSIIDAAVLGLLSLLVAFWFSLAGAHLDLRRSLIVEEANAIGTAWLRLDLLPLATRSTVQDLFRDYVDIRMAETPSARSRERRASLDEQLDGVRGAIWKHSVDAGRQCASPQAAMLLLDALNAMFDAGTRHEAATNAHTPTAVPVLLAGVAVVASLLTGHEMGRSQTFSWFHPLLFAVVVSTTIGVIYDLEKPRYGLIRIDDYDKTMRDVRQGFDRGTGP
ncbi:MAG: DUF4239 domain-containing protein [Planctomycetota bacterium]|nr:MAG: DUF4239 domain-containing protein [Planctomycetota bacterium]